MLDGRGSDQSVVHRSAGHPEGGQPAQQRGGGLAANRVDGGTMVLVVGDNQRDDDACIDQGFVLGNLHDWWRSASRQSSPKRCARVRRAHGPVGQGATLRSRRRRGGRLTLSDSRSECS